MTDRGGCATPPAELGGRSNRTSWSCWIVPPNRKGALRLTERNTDEGGREDYSAVQSNMLFISLVTFVSFMCYSVRSKCKKVDRSKQA